MATNLLLFITGVIAAVIYGMQLHEMRGSGEQTAQLLKLYSQQKEEMGRLARATENLAGYAKASAEQAKSQQEQTASLAASTHDLAIAAGKQASSASVQSQAAVDLAHTTQDLAVSAGKQADSAKVQAQAALDLSNRTAEIAAVNHQQFESSQRPWLQVKVDAKATLQVFSGAPSVLIFHVSGTNVGHSPALNVHLGAIAVVNQGLSDPPLSRLLQSQCSGSSGALESQIVFPGAQYKSGLGVQLSHQTTMLNPFGLTMQAYSDGKPAPPAPAVLSVIGCVTYQADFSSTVRYTTFVVTGELPSEYSKPADYPINLSADIGGYGDHAY